MFIYEISGMLTITDFINILHKYYKSPEVSGNMILSDFKFRTPEKLEFLILDILENCLINVFACREILGKLIFISREIISVVIILTVMMNFSGWYGWVGGTQDRDMER